MGADMHGPRWGIGHASGSAMLLVPDNYFLYGKQFTLETDQKPLVSIYRKHMVEILPRIQRLVVRSFPYQPFDVQYRRGKEIPLADALSQVSPTPVEEDGFSFQLLQ